MELTLNGVRSFLIRPLPVLKYKSWWVLIVWVCCYVGLWYLCRRLRCYNTDFVMAFVSVAMISNSCSSALRVGYTMLSAFKQGSSTWMLLDAAHFRPCDDRVTSLSLHKSELDDLVPLLGLFCSSSRSSWVCSHAASMVNPWDEGSQCIRSWLTYWVSSPSDS